MAASLWASCVTVQLHPCAGAVHASSFQRPSPRCAGAWCAHALTHSWRSERVGATSFDSRTDSRDRHSASSTSRRSAGWYLGYAHWQATPHNRRQVRHAQCSLWYLITSFSPPDGVAVATLGGSVRWPCYPHARGVAQKKPRDATDQKHHAASRQRLTLAQAGAQSGFPGWFWFWF